MKEQNYKLKLCVNGVEIEVAGDKEFVEKKFNELKAEYCDKDNQNVANIQTLHPEENKNVSNKGNISIIEFVNSKKPKPTATELMPVLVYYFKQYENKEQFNENDIKSLYRRYDISKRPKKIYQAILDINRNKAYFESVPKAKGYFRLTEAGEYFVETKLSENR